MTASPKSLDRATRMSDSDYPGTLRLAGEGWRVVVSPDGRRYRLQPLVRVPHGEVWVSPPSLVGATLSALLEKCAGVVEGLAEFCEGLPDDPALACPELVGQRQALLADLAAERSKASDRLKDRRADFFRKSAEKRAVGRGSGLRP